MTNPLEAADLRARVQACVDAELDAQAGVLAEVGPDADVLLDAVRRLLSGGKRLRAGFLYWGYRAAGGSDSPELIRLATAMELFQAAALIHDDVMDDSDTRRGMPSAHRALEAHHGERRWEGDAGRFGAAGAILAGNLCLTWCDEMVATCGLPAEEVTRGRGMFDTMRTQLMAGQFLDVAEASVDWRSLSQQERIERALHVITYKSAKYSIEHPLLIGARAGGLDGAALESLADYGLALGRAFQLRDDVLGVFGDPEVTGKPAGDDLREGKRTVLIAHTLAGASPEDQETVWSLLGDPGLGAADVERLRSIVRDSGGLDQVERHIDGLVASAREALGAARPSIDAEAADALDALIDVSTARAF
ncbi:polyprenyl synthetase family protein [Actinomycetota bacterium]